MQQKLNNFGHFFYIESKFSNGMDIYEVTLIHGKSNLIFEAIYAFTTNFRCDIFVTSQFCSGKVNFSNSDCNVKRIPKYTKCVPNCQEIGHKYPWCLPNCQSVPKLAELPNWTSGSLTSLLSAQHLMSPLATAIDDARMLSSFKLVNCFGFSCI